LTGDGPDGAWTLEALQIYVRVGSGTPERPAWALVAPVNHPLVVSYGDPRPTARVSALINNVDVSDQPPLTAQAGRVPIHFEVAPGGQTVKDLHDGRVLRAPSLASFEFEPWPGATEDDVVAFCVHAGSLCAYATGTHNGIPLVTYIDAAGRPVRRVVRAPLEGPRPTHPALDPRQVPDGLTRLFRDCFDEHVRIQRSALPWRKLPSYCGAIEDAGFLEQKFATLMMAIEFFFRTSLLEAHAANESELERMSITDLIGRARTKLQWNIPKHYVRKGLVRLLRNAVAHGGELPTKDAIEFRAMFDKWRLLLSRRVLIRLGYTGRVASPERGYASSSPVDDFSEEHNSFGSSAESVGKTRAD